MSLLPPLSYLFQTAVGHTAKFGMDYKEIWDDIVNELDQRGLLPTTKAGRLKLLAILSLTASTTRWHLGNKDSALAQIINALANDAPSRLGVNMFKKNAQRTPAVPGPSTADDVRSCLEQLTARLESYARRP